MLLLSPTTQGRLRYTEASPRVSSSCLFGVWLYSVSLPVPAGCFLKSRVDVALGGGVAPAASTLP